MAFGMNTNEILITVEEVIPQGSVAVGFGKDQNGNPVCFAGDWRMMQEVQFAIEAGENPEVSVESWQIIG